MIIQDSVKDRGKTVLRHGMSTAQAKPLRSIEMCRNAKGKKHVT